MKLKEIYTESSCIYVNSKFKLILSVENFETTYIKVGSLAKFKITNMEERVKVLNLSGGK